MFATFVSSTLLKEYIDITGINKICEIHNITSPEDLWNQSHKWDNCEKMEFLGSNFSKIVFSRALIFLPGNKLKHLKFVNVGFSEIRQRDFCDFNELQHLNISENKISHLPSQIFSQLPCLISVDLSSNLINSVNQAAFNNISSTLEIIDLSFNKILTFNESSLIYLNINVTLNLESNLINKFVQIPENYLDHSRLKMKHLNLHNNILNNFQSSNVEIKDLNLSNNHLRTFTITKEMIKVNLKNNNITQILFNRNVKIESLNLSGNKLSKKSLHGLKEAARLKQLDISNNELEGLHSNTFANLNVLEELNLAASGLKNLSSQLLAHQNNLKILNVSCNNLKIIDINLFNTMKNLEILDISGNRWIKLDNFKNVREHFPKMKAVTLENKDCNGEYLSIFIKLFQEEGIIVNNFSPKCERNAAEKKNYFLFITIMIGLFLLLIFPIFFYLKFV